MILPVTTVQRGDVKDASYKPINERDQENYDMYDPELFAEAPVSVQLVGRNLQEESLLAIAMAVDAAIKK